MRGKAPTRNAVIAVAAILALACPSAALAGKSGGGGKPSGGTTGSGGGTISLVLLNSTDGLPHWGQQITFNISTTATDQPWVHLKCIQNRTVVAEGWDGYFDGSLSGRNFGLYSGKWSGGAADCTGYLEKPDWTVLAATSFHVYA